MRTRPFRSVAKKLIIVVGGGRHQPAIETMTPQQAGGCRRDRQRSPLARPSRRTTAGPHASVAACQTQDRSSTFEAQAWDTLSAPLVPVAQSPIREGGSAAPPSEVASPAAIFRIVASWIGVPAWLSTERYTLPARHNRHSGVASTATRSRRRRRHIGGSRRCARCPMGSSTSISSGSSGVTALGAVIHEYRLVAWVFGAHKGLLARRVSRRRIGQGLEEVSSEGMHRPSGLGRVKGGGRRCAGSRYSRSPSLS